MNGTNKQISTFGGLLYYVTSVLEHLSGADNKGERSENRISQLPNKFHGHFATPRICNFTDLLLS